MSIEYLDKTGLSYFWSKIKSKLNPAYDHSQIPHAPADAEKNIEPQWDEETETLILGEED